MIVGRGGRISFLRWERKSALSVRCVFISIVTILRAVLPAFFSFFSPTFTFSVHMVWVGFYWFTFLFIMDFWSISHSTVFLLQLAFAWLGLLVIFVSCILTEFDCHWVLVGTPGKT
jgi:hypothetical protein